MIVRRLAWAGLELQTPDATAVVDLLGGRPELSKWAGAPAKSCWRPAAQPGQWRLLRSPICTPITSTSTR